MLKIFENFDFSRVGQVQSLLESQGIPTYLKNQFSSSVMGEVPFVEVCPQLYILNAKDWDKAQQLLQLERPEPDLREAWVCPRCGMNIEGQFAQCWSCAQECSVNEGA